MSNRAAILDVRCPINWSHPLNGGLLHEWVGAPAPGWSGGITVHDLVRGAKNPTDGSLTAGSLWRSGFSSLLAVKASGGSDLSVPIPACVHPYYLSFWVYVDSFPANFAAVLDDAGRLFSAFYDTAGNNDFGKDYGHLATGVWTHLVQMVDLAGSISLWNNGVRQSIAGGGADVTATTLNFGSNPSGGGSSINARYALIQFGNRIVNVPELYKETRRGNPNRWNWLPQRVWFVPQAAAATGAFNAAWARQSSVLIGGGCVP